MSQAAGNGRSSQSDGPCANTIFEHQFQLALEQFKFHAEQRTRMFHFFLLAAGLLLTAFSWLIRASAQSEAVVTYDAYAFILLCVGGILSTMFLTLDIRNVQLLEMSEDVLERMEEWYLYPIRDWHAPVRSEPGDIRLGIYSREALLKKYIADGGLPEENKTFFRWIYINNLKHKLAIRIIFYVSIISFWMGAIFMTDPRKLWNSVLFPADIVIVFEILGLALSLVWSCHALKSPRRHRGWERKALIQKKKEMGLQHWFVR